MGWGGDEEAETEVTCVAKADGALHGLSELELHEYSKILRRLIPRSAATNGVPEVARLLFGKVPGSWEDLDFKLFGGGESSRC